MTLAELYNVFSDVDEVHVYIKESEDASTFLCVLQGDTPLNVYLKDEFANAHVEYAHIYRGDSLQVYIAGEIPKELI